MAEEVGYNIIGETKKDTIDVIGYNIREEQTKDAFAEENANNQTTTGMANVIPGINAPKLLSDTSIIGGGGMRIVNISDYESVSEWQPVVERVIGGEYMCVRCKFTSYSNTYLFYFTPCEYIPNQVIRFVALYPRTKWFQISCALSGTTITSITTSNGTP